MTAEVVIDRQALNRGDGEAGWIVVLHWKRSKVKGFVVCDTLFATLDAAEKYAVQFAGGYYKIAIKALRPAGVQR